MVQKKRLFLIDGSSYAYRAFYAIKNLGTSKGKPTNAVYGFTRLLMKLVREERPDYLAVAFDLPAPTFRHKEFAEYKAQRPEMPDDLQSQIPLIKEVISAFNIPLFELEGYEADDILATLARRAEKEGMDVFILTPDKDILQIVGDSIKVLSFHKEGLIYDEDKVRERFGVRPQEMPDLMSLMGDSSDNIPGVPGIGEKTAAKLIQEFESLESVLNNLERIPNKKQRESLKKFSEQAELSKRLATIDEKVPLSVDFQQLRSGEANRERLAEIFRELEFRKLVEEITLEGRESQELFADLD
ncbi:hypothetical protein KAX00_02050 [bacterium]|nr:hypothetical protein [bacterium]